MREIVVTWLEAAVQQGATVVDVREPMEYAETHVPGAVLIPMGQLDGQRPFLRA
jgi:rhodanese-related sulfurtransferase